MASNDQATPGSTINNMFRDVRTALSEIFGGGKPDAKQQLQIEVLFGLLGIDSRADGVVSDVEARYTNELMDELNLPTAARKLATEAFDRGCRHQLDPDEEIQRFMNEFRRGSSEVDRLYESLLRLAAADARIRPGERVFLEKVTRGLGFAAGELDARMQRILP